MIPRILCDDSLDKTYLKVSTHSHMENSIRRGRFLRFLFSAAAIITMPIVSLARKITNTRPLVIRAGKDRYDKPLPIFDGDMFYTKVGSADSNQGLYIFESTRDKKGGPPLHVHPDQDEWWYILEGEFLFKIGEETFKVGKGDCVFGPRGIPHTFSKINDGASRIIILYQPAGKMEEHFQFLSAGKANSMTPEERKELGKKNGFLIVGPALTDLKY